MGTAAVNDGFGYPLYGAGAGVRTPFGLFLPPGSNAVYLRSTGIQSGDDPAIAARLVQTLSAACQRIRSGTGDVIYVLPGHSESVTDATMLSNLVAGTRIIGLGDPHRSDAPVFRWTAAGSSWAVSVANVEIANLRLRLEGANGVTKAINVTAAGFTLRGCYIETASGASNKATIAAELGEGATDALIQGNYVTGTETHNSTDVFKLVGSTAPNHNARFLDNVMVASATAANGLIHVTTACKRFVAMRNVIYNTHTASTACIVFDNVAADGVVAYNSLGTVNDGTAASQGLTFGAAALVKAFENYSADEPKKSGALAPGVVAT